MTAGSPGPRLVLIVAFSLVLSSCGPMAAAPTAQPSPLPTAAPSPSPSPSATASPTATQAATIRPVVTVSSSPGQAGPTSLPLTALPVATVSTGNAQTPPPAATPAASQPGSVTLADDGKTIELHPGDRFLLDLGEGFDWGVNVADSSIVSRIVNITVIRGAQGVYEAKRPGTTTLSATGDPPCRKAQPACMAPSRLFRIQINVR